MENTYELENFHTGQKVNVKKRDIIKSVEESTFYDDETVIGIKVNMWKPHEIIVEFALTGVIALVYLGKDNKNLLVDWDESAIL